MKEPFINHMFPEGWMPPFERYFKARTESVDIYHHYEKYRDEDEMSYCEFCDEELGYDSDNDEYLECNCADAKDSSTGHPKLSNMTLQSILDLLPEGVEPKDVTITMNLDMGGMGIYGHELRFSYNKTFEDDPEGFEAAQKKYEANHQAYLVEKQKYDDWKRQEEINKLEKQLASLKK